jgi:hypothetical protein
LPRRRHQRGFGRFLRPHPPHHPELDRATHPDFADARVVRALFERAMGFSGKVTRTTLYRGEKHTITTTVSCPLDTQACVFWLRNRQPEYWQARAEAPPDLEVIDDDLARWWGTSGVAEIAENKFYVARSAPLGRDSSTADNLVTRIARACVE